MSKGYSLILVRFVLFDITVNKIVELQMILYNLDGSTKYIVYIFVNSPFVGK